MVYPSNWTEKSIIGDPTTIDFTPSSLSNNIPPALDVYIFNNVSEIFKSRSLARS